MSARQLVCFGLDVDAKLVDRVQPGGCADLLWVQLEQFHGVRVALLDLLDHRQDGADLDVVSDSRVEALDCVVDIGNRLRAGARARLEVHSDQDERDETERDEDEPQGS